MAVSFSRLVDARFDEPPEVDDGREGGEVDEAVEALPVFSTHQAEDGGGTGEGEGEEDDPGEEADLDEAALFEVVEYGGPDGSPLREDLAGMAVAGGRERGGDVVAGEEEDVGGQVEGGVEEGVEAEEAAEADEPGDAGGEAAEGGDGEREEEDPEGPVAGEVGDVVDGVRVEGEGAVAIDEQEMGEGGEQEEVGERLDEEDGALRHGCVHFRAAGLGSRANPESGSSAFGEG